MSGSSHVLAVDVDLADVVPALEALDRDSDVTLSRETDGDAALERLRDGVTVDCLVSTAGQDGVALLDAVREVVPDLPIVLVATEDDPAETIDALTGGATDVLRPQTASDQRAQLVEARIRNAIETPQVDGGTTERNPEKIINRVTDGIVAVDEDWRFTMVDDRAAAIYDMTESELVGKNFWDVFEAALGTQFEREYRTVMETREPTTFTAYYDGTRDESGLVGWFEVDVYPEPDGGVAFYFRDVTERKERERELEQERERYRNLVENSPAPVNLFDADGTAVWGNDALLELLGLEELSDLEGRSVFDFIHPDDHGIGEDELERVIEQGETVGPTNFRIVRDDGEIRHVQVNTTAGWYEGERVGQAVVIDVTDLRETEQELRENEQRYRTLVEMSPDPVLVHIDGEIVYANDAMVDFVDADTPETLQESHINRYLDPREHDDAERTARLTQRGETLPTRHERTVVTLDGDRRHVETISRPIAYEGNAAVLTVIKDVTDRYRYEQMLTTLHDRTRAMTRADDRETILEVVVETTDELLDLDATLLYEFDGDDQLVPASWSPATGDSPTTAPEPAGSDTLLWDTFVTGEECFVTDWSDEDQPHPDVPFGAGLILPVGNHGILVTGATEEVTLTTTQREMAHLIAENLAAALDRAGREADLRERDQQLQRQNTALEQLNRLNGVIRQINQTLVRSSSRAEIEESVCERLAATEQYTFAWIGTQDDDGRVRPAQWSGMHPEYVDQLATAETPTPLHELVERAGRERSVQVARAILDDPEWESHRSEALRQGYRAVAAVPVVKGPHLDGVLVIHATEGDIFDERERAVLAELGETIGYALRNVERVDALDTDERTEVDLSISDDRLFTNRLTAALDADVEFVGAIADDGETYRTFLRFDRALPAEVEQRLEGLETVVGIQPLAVEHGSDDRLEGDDTDGNGADAGHASEESVSALYQVTITEPRLIATLREHDARLRTLTAADGTTSLTVVLTDDASVRALVESLQHSYPETELMARRADPDPVDTHETFRDRIVGDLTDKQLDALQTAQYGGFYEWPRAATSEELAGTRGISAPTFQYHLRAAERKIISEVLDPF